jgi:hypothetical protein
MYEAGTVPTASKKTNLAFIYGQLPQAADITPQSISESMRIVVAAFYLTGQLAVVLD